MSPTDTAPRPPRAMGLADVVMFNVVAGFGLQWVATAAAGGLPALVLLPCAFGCFYLPLALSVMELSSRYPHEGGLYVWTREAFGEFVGFNAGWCYWFSNLPFIANCLYFAASNALYLGGDRWMHLAADPWYYVVFSIVALLLITVANIVGLGFVKWIFNFGAVGMWAGAAAVMVLGVLAWHAFGSATPMVAVGFKPRLRLDNMLFWSTLAFGFCGVEAAAFMAEEIEEPRRTIPRALIISGATVAFCYFFGTLAMLVILPASQINGLVGPIAAVSSAAHRLGLAWVVPVAALAMAVGVTGSAGGYLGACARIPFAVGVDKRLPPVFARLHPRWGTPWAALALQSALGAALMLLSQAGATVRAAYDVLISITIVANFIPYVLLFAALIKVQGRPVTTGVTRVPGGRPVAMLVAGLGLVTTLAAIALAFVPSADDPHRLLTAAKVVGALVVMLAVGWTIFCLPPRDTSCTRKRVTVKGMR